MFYLFSAFCSGPPRAQTLPTCATKDKLLNAGVWSKSGQWRPDSLQKHSFANPPPHYPPLKLPSTDASQLRKRVFEHSFGFWTAPAPPGTKNPDKNTVFSGRFCPDRKTKKGHQMGPKEPSLASTPEVAIIFRGDSVSSHPGARGAPQKHKIAEKNKKLLSVSGFVLLYPPV